MKVNTFKLILQAVELLKDRGVLVYSTCTITAEENENVVAWALQRFPCLELTVQVSFRYLEEINANITLDNKRQILRVLN